MKQPLIFLSLAMAMAAPAAPAHCATDQTSATQASTGQSPPPCSAQEAQGTEQSRCLSVMPMTTDQAAQVAPAPHTGDKWAVGLAAGAAPRDGAPAGSYQAISLYRQLGHSYAQAGVMHYHSTLIQPGTSVASDYVVGTLGFGGHYGPWVVDAYGSYGGQGYGNVITSDGPRAPTTKTGSPYWGAGLSFGRMMPVGDRVFLTPTVSGSYAWGRLLRPVPAGGTDNDFSTSEPTWTGTGRMRVDWLVGQSRRSYVGMSVAGIWSNNATSYLGGFGAGPLGSYTATSVHVHDAWSEVTAHGSLAITPSMRIEANASRTIGLIAGDATMFGVGVRRSF